MAVDDFEQLLEETVNRALGSLRPAMATIAEIASPIEGRQGRVSGLMTVTKADPVRATEKADGESGLIGTMLNKPLSTAMGLRSADSLGTVATGGVPALLSRVFGLFMGHSSAEETPYPEYVRPRALDIEAGISEANKGAIYLVDHNQQGRTRLSSEAGIGPGPQIQIQVNALDSRSFMDRSGEIARAVKDAMLNSHTLNDVVADF